MLKFLDHYTTNETGEERFPTSKPSDSDPIFANRRVLIGVIGGSVILLIIIAGMAIYYLCGRDYFKSRTAVQSGIAVKYNCSDAEEAEHV